MTMIKKIFMAAVIFGIIGTAFGGENKISAEWDFTNPQTRKAWTTSPKVDLKFINSPNSLKLKITGKDPYILSPVNAGGFAASKFRNIAVKMKCSRTANTFNEIFWIIRTQMTWNGAKHIGFPVKAEPNKYKVYDFDMSTNSLWRDIVKRFRLDLFNGAPIGSIIEIEWIKISGGPVSCH